MKRLRDVRVQHVIAALVGLSVLVIVIQDIRWAIGMRQMRPALETVRLFREWRGALLRYRDDHGEFPLHTLASDEVAEVLKPYSQETFALFQHLDGFGRPLHSGGPGRGWSRVISSGRNGIHESGAGDDMLLDVEE
jgi:hypothetical protein